MSTPSKKNTKAVKAKRSTNGTGAVKTKCVAITMTAQEEYFAIVNVPVDVTEAELKEIATDIAGHGPCERGDEPTVLVHYEVEECDEGDT